MWASLGLDVKRAVVSQCFASPDLLYPASARSETLALTRGRSFAPVKGETGDGGGKMGRYRHAIRHFFT